MSEFHEHYKSPMEDVFSWNTPAGHSSVKKGETSTGGNSSHNKRRSDDDDSGYATPSHSFSKSRLMNTPMSVVSEFPMPCHTAPAEMKRRTDDMSMSVDTFNELSTEPSLYTEPMDVSPPDPPILDFSPHAQAKSLSPCNENVVDLEQSSTTYLPGLTPQTPRSSRRSSPVKCLNFSLSPVKRATHRRRFLNGFEHLDILYFLGVKMNFPNIVDKILGHLSGEDLSSIRLVSKSWKEVADSARTAKQVWLQHVGHVMINKENIVNGSGEWSSSKRGTPLVVFNHSTPFHERQPRTPPTSPSKFNLFRMAAQGLRHNQNLMHCPRCRGPSACTPEERLGECVSPVCLYRFCSVCKRFPHVGSCPDLFPSSPPNTPPKRMPTVGSKRSRRNLRRL